MFKKCTRLWREAHLEAKSVKNWRVRTTFWSWDVERCGAKHISKSKCTKHTTFRALLEVDMFKQCTPLWREVRMLKTPHACATFGRWSVVCVAGARDSAPFQEWAKREGFVAGLKTMAGCDIWRGSAKMDWIWRGGRSTRDMFIRDVRRSVISCEGLHFGASDRQVYKDDFASQVQHFVWLGITFSWQAQYFRQIERKNCKNALVRGRLRSTFHSGRKSRRIASFLMLSSWNIEEVLQNSFAFDVVKSKNWGSLAELLRFDAVKFKHWGSLAELQLQLQLHELHYTNCNTLRYTTLDLTRLDQNILDYATLNYATLHYATLHHATLHYTRLRYTTLHYANYKLQTTQTTTTTTATTTLLYITLH